MQWQDRDLAVTTVHDYVRDWECIKETLNIEHIRELRENDFLDMMETLVGKYAEGRLEKYRGAVKRQQIAELPECDQWYRTERFRMRFGGLLKEAAAKFKAKRSQVAREKGNKDVGSPNDVEDGTRGALQVGKAIEVTAAFKKKGMDMYAKGAAVTYAGAFRHEEVREFTLADLKKEEDGKYYLRVVGGKSRPEDMVEWVWIEGIDNTMEEFLKEKEWRGHGALFEGWEEDVAVNMVHECAREGNWDPNRKWDWHSFRHGRAVDWRLEGMPQEERMRRGRWHDKRTEEWYSRIR